MEDSNHHSRKKRMVLVCPHTYPNPHFFDSSGVPIPSSIDREDYLVGDAVANQLGAERCLERYHVTDENHRLTSLPILGWKGKDLMLPHCFTKLSRLTRLRFGQCTAIESLPASVERLQNLQELILYKNPLSELPDGIGNMISLVKLDLSETKITSLPASIGRLQNLQELNLRSTPLTNLPEEIGDLVSLIKLNLYSTTFTSLPNSIGRLKNLQELNLRNVKQFSLWQLAFWKLKNALDLPETIGCLSSLNTLDLSRTGISTLPASIGKLKNLKDLDLSETENLLRLPDEIGDLTSLKALNLQNSGIVHLPESTKRLKGLMCILVDGTFLLTALAKDPSDFLLELVQHSPFLGCIDPGLLVGRKKVQFALACNRARFRTGFGRSTGNAMAPKLWPLLLDSATKAFGWYDPKQIGDFLKWKYQCSISMASAIYQLLVDGREQFVIMTIGN